MVLGAENFEGLSGHTAGRQLLARLYRQAIAADMPAIEVTSRGKPYFSHGAVHFSISHTDGVVFCVLSDRPVGIDAEKKTRTVDPALAEKLLSPAEKSRYAMAEDKNAALLRLWVLKEAYAKATGRGFGSYLSRTDFDPNDPRITEQKDCYVAVIEL